MVEEVLLEGEHLVYCKEIEIEKRLVPNNQIENVFLGLKVIEYRKMNEENVSSFINDKSLKGYIPTSKSCPVNYLRDKNIDPYKLYTVEKLEITLTSDDHIFTLVKAIFTQDDFERLKRAKNLEISFHEFSAEVINLIEGHQRKIEPSKLPKNKKKHGDHENIVKFIVYEGGRGGDEKDLYGSMIFEDVLSLKRVEIFSLDFKQCSEEECHYQAQQRFLQCKKELRMQSEMLKCLREEIKTNCPFILEVIKRKPSIETTPFGN